MPKGSAVKRSLEVFDNPKLLRKGHDRVYWQQRRRADKKFSHLNKVEFDLYSQFVELQANIRNISPKLKKVKEVKLKAVQVLMNEMKIHGFIFQDDLEPGRYLISHPAFIEEPAVLPGFAALREGSLQLERNDEPRRDPLPTIESKEVEKLANELERAKLT